MARARRRERPRGPEPLSAILQRVIDRRGRPRACSSEEVVHAWRKAAGEELARHTKVVGLKRGVLHVAVDSSVLYQQLVGFRRGELLTALRNQFERLYIQQIRFTPGAPAGRGPRRRSTAFDER